jgi:dTMP kinase
MVPDLDSARSAFDDQHPRSAAVRRLRTVALVGIDGSGKTTQARQLATALAEWGLPATYRRNAGGRRWFGRLAAALAAATGSTCSAARTMLLVESVLRWLAILRTLLRRSVTGEIAIMDRYAVCQFASIRAHAKTPRPERLNRAERRARLAYRVFPQPDVTFLLAVDPAVAYDRIEQRGYDHEEMAYLRAATAAYQALPSTPVRGHRRERHPGAGRGRELRRLRAVRPRSAARRRRLWRTPGAAADGRDPGRGRRCSPTSWRLSRLGQPARRPGCARRWSAPSVPARKAITGRSRRRDPAGEVGVRLAGPVRRGVDDARQHGVAPHALLLVLDRDRVREGQHRGLGGRVAGRPANGRPPPGTRRTPPNHRRRPPGAAVSPPSPGTWGAGSRG